MDRTADAFEKLHGEKKTNDILMVAGQLGGRYRGRSVRRACLAMDAHEFGLGAYAIGIILLTHPERLTHHYDLHIDCAGDEYSIRGNDSYHFTPVFMVGCDHRLRFKAELSNGSGSIRGGSASAFLPQ